RKPAARGLSAVPSDERSNREKILLRQGYGGARWVFQAPTGSGKTYIFELLYPNLKNSGGVHCPDPRTDNGQRFRATPTRVHAPSPKTTAVTIIYHKPFMIEARITRSDEGAHELVIQIHDRSFHAS